MISSRPLWKGSISFGLVSIPIKLYPAENPTDLHFHLLDKRNHARIHYERVNEITGKPVPWNEIVKSYEFEKGKYVLVDEKELEKTAYENFETIEIEDFIDLKSLDPMYFERPYYLVPSKQGEKGYALLLSILKETQKVGIAKVVIRTRQHLAALLPCKEVLVLNLLRFHNQLRKIEDYKISNKDVKKYSISKREMDMAERLVNSMTRKWDPKRYHDENRELLSSWIEKKVKKGKSVSTAKPKTTSTSKTKVIDFMELLKESVEKKKRGNAHKEHKTTLAKKKKSSRS